MKLIDLCGRRFGRLVVMERAPSKKNEAQWLCRCDCGKITIVSGSNLRNSHTKSCGCLRETDIIGCKFGTMTVIECLPDGSYRMQCDCGRIESRGYATVRQHKNSMCCAKCAQVKRAQSISMNYEDGTQPSRIQMDKPPTKANHSGVTGVNWDKSRGKWQASIRFKGKKYNLGRYDDFEEAVKARKKAEQEIFEPYIKAREDSKK